MSQSDQQSYIWVLGPPEAPIQDMSWPLLSTRFAVPHNPLSCLLFSPQPWKDFAEQCHPSQITWCAIHLIEENVKGGIENRVLEWIAEFSWWRWSGMMEEADIRDDDAVVWIYDERGGVLRRGATISRLRNRMLDSKRTTQSQWRQNGFRPCLGVFYISKLLGLLGAMDPRTLGHVDADWKRTDICFICLQSVFEVISLFVIHTTVNWRWVTSQVSQVSPGASEENL